jgi:SAM-dependent methyltransferase
MNPAAHQLTHESEIRFHDEWAASVDLARISVREAFEAPTALENRFILSQMGPLAGKRVLDVGAGLGESSVYFALQGAEVTTTDISPGMVETAVRLGQLHGVRLRPLVTSAEGLQTEEGYYDFVYVANTIHHVADRRKLFENIHCALTPGGKFFSWDPLAYNPVINVYRRMATEVRSHDETPLTVRDVELARQFFPDVHHREFWITALALFVKYYLFDRVHPNHDRYWKRIFTETDRSLIWGKPLRVLDELLTRTPGVRLLAWNMVMWGTKQGDDIAT